MENETTEPKTDWSGVLKKGEEIIELIENFALDAFLSIADKTRLELARLGQIAQKHSYQSGEITGPGTFICDVCGKEIAFKTPSEIPECPQCHAHTFVRM